MYWSILYSFWLRMSNKNTALGWNWLVAYWCYARLGCTTSERKYWVILEHDKKIIQPLDCGKTTYYMIKPQTALNLVKNLVITFHMKFTSPQGELETEFTSDDVINLDHLITQNYSNNLLPCWIAIKHTGTTVHYLNHQ